MPRINLLPWREELRKQKQKEFGIMVGLAGLAMVGIIFLVQVQIGQMIENQKRRNHFLDEEIAKIDKKIKEIKDLEKEKENLLARMNVVEQLQTSRPEVVHLFDELVTALPDGVYLTSLVQKGRSITLEGYAQSNARVSSFMRNLDNSPWLTSPDLKRIQAVTRSDLGSVRLSRFTLVVTQTKPKAKGDEDGEGAAK